MVSTASEVSRKPAVSINLYSRPLIKIVSSIVSRVVPGISDTIALSSFRRAFSNVDLPELGLPVIATGMPFLITFPIRNDDASLPARSLT